MVNFIFLTSVFCKGLYYHVACSRYDKVGPKGFQSNSKHLVTQWGLVSHQN